jgi:enterochelin esterase-like enzyme
MRPDSAMLVPTTASPKTPRPQRRRARRLVLAAVAIAWITVGFVGVYSYFDNYYVHRGFATPQRLATAGSGRLMSVRFYSAALHKTDSYLIYLPSGYSRARRYPVFYLLHGLPGRSVSFTVIGHIEINMENLISQHRMGPMILVFPDGRIDGNTFSDSEWANTPSGNFDSSVAEVVRNVDDRFSTVANRKQRVIAGLSAGAYGAINIALHHLRTFGSLEVWSGYFIETRTGVFANASPAQLAYNSPLLFVHSLARTLHRYVLRAFLFVGRTDPASSQIVPMARSLRAEGAAVRYAIYPGGHDWELWNQHLDQMLILAWHDTTTAFPHPHGAARTTRRSGHHRAAHRPAALRRARRRGARQRNRRH